MDNNNNFSIPLAPAQAAESPVRNQVASFMQELLIRSRERETRRQASRERMARLRARNDVERWSRAAILVQQRAHHLEEIQQSNAAVAAAVAAAAGAGAANNNNNSDNPPEEGLSTLTQRRQARRQEMQARRNEAIASRRERARARMERVRSRSSHPTLRSVYARMEPRPTAALARVHEASGERALESGVANESENGQEELRNPSVRISHRQRPIQQQAESDEQRIFSIWGSLDQMERALEESNARVEATLASLRQLPDPVSALRGRQWERAPSQQDQPSQQQTDGATDSLNSSSQQNAARRNTESLHSLIDEVTRLSEQAESAAANMGLLSDRQGQLSQQAEENSGREPDEPTQQSVPAENPFQAIQRRLSQVEGNSARNAAFLERLRTRQEQSSQQAEGSSGSDVHELVQPSSEEEFPSLIERNLAEVERNGTRVREMLGRLSSSQGQSSLRTVEDSVEAPQAHEQASTRQRFEELRRDLEMASVDYVITRRRLDRRSRVPVVLHGNAYVKCPTPEEVQHDKLAPEGAGICIICHENVPTCIALPCLHMAYCVGCARLICLDRRNNPKQKGEVNCAKCRKPADSIMRVFHE